MYRQVLFAMAALLLVAGCAGAAQTGTDTTLPAIRLTLLNSTGLPSFVSEASGDVILSGPSPCGTARHFPARFAVAASDMGGIHTVTVRVEPASTVASSITVEPAAPVSDVAITPDGTGEILLTTLAIPGDGLTQASVLIVADVDGQPPIRLDVSATDRAGNFNVMRSVEIRAIGDEIVDLSGERYDCRTGARFVEVDPNG
jgi:hypothetical protein